MKHKKRGVSAIIVSVFLCTTVALLSGCNEPTSNGSRVKNEDGYAQNIQEATGTDLHTMKPKGMLDIEKNESNSSVKLPILDELNQNTFVGTTGSFMTAVQSAVKLLDWGVNTGLDPEEIKDATVAWLVDKGNDEQVEFAEKLALVDEAYQRLLSDGAEDLLSSAGCDDAAYPWSDAPVESVEAIMEAVGLR